MIDTITERVVTGVAVVLSLTLAGVIVAILTVIIFIMKRRTLQNTDNAFTSNGIYSATISCIIIVYLLFYTYCQCCCSLVGSIIVHIYHILCFLYTLSSEPTLLQEGSSLY